MDQTAFAKKSLVIVKQQFKQHLHCKLTTPAHHSCSTEPELSHVTSQQKNNLQGIFADPVVLFSHC